MTEQQSAEGAPRWAELWVITKTFALVGVLSIVAIFIFGTLFGMITTSIGDIVLLILGQDPVGIPFIFTEDLQPTPSAAPRSMAIGTGVLLVGALLFWIDHIANQKVNNQ